jgi:hypothetical protein
LWVNESTPDAYEKDGIEVVEVVAIHLLTIAAEEPMLGDQLRIGTNISVVEPGNVAQVLHDGQGMRDTIVLESIAHVAPGQ